MPFVLALCAPLDVIFATPRYLIFHRSLIFPQCRPTTPRLFGSVRNILRSVNTLPHQFNKCHATTSTCLHLPIAEILVHSLPTNHPIATLFQPPTTILPPQSTIWKLHGSDVFTFKLPHLTPQISSNHKISSTQHLQQESHLTHPIQPTTPQQLRYLQFPFTRTSSCPSKYAVWSTALSTYIDLSLRSPTFAQYLDFVCMRSNLTISSDTLYPTLSTHRVFSCMLQAIWNSQYRFTFDKTPFNPTQVLTAVDGALYTLNTQDNIHQPM
ncbi:hypothetical protein [Parasitella parasitica]|uniref:Uncharacterized protein n=1 Tax=Parasitella parasitica TaxID=35722 RepID=A0A0B7N0H5_9FUNG|nr:hypothetical protein [Parasitella parasitica]